MRHDFLLADEQQLEKYFDSAKASVIRSGSVKLSEIQEEISLAEEKLGRMQSDTMLIPITGSIEYRMSFECWLFGGTSVVGILNALRMAKADPACSRVMLLIDSPGGSYPGVPECAAAIYALRGQKQCVAIADPMAASAALWLGAAAERFCCVPSGSVGSIGAVSMLATWARMLNEAGIDLEFIRSTPFKAEYTGAEAITPELRQHTQGLIDDIGGEFIAAVAKYRGVSTKDVREKFGSGRMLRAADAKAVGLIDAISTIDDELSKRPKAAAKAGRPRASLSELRRPVANW